jgi:3-oxoacyl-[acyl-carrier protein] reductase
MREGGRVISIGSCFNGRVPAENFVLQATWPNRRLSA